MPGDGMVDRLCLLRAICCKVRLLGSCDCQLIIQHRAPLLTLRRLLSWLMRRRRLRQMSRRDLGRRNRGFGTRFETRFETRPEGSS